MTTTDPPRSIKELNALAKINTDDCIPIEIYISSADLFVKQARIYFREENHEQAYLYYLKYINLMLNELSQRPSFDHSKYQAMIQTCVEALDAIELVRPSIEAVYESYELFQETEEKGKKPKKKYQQKSSNNKVSTSTTKGLNEKVYITPTVVTNLSIEKPVKKQINLIDLQSSPTYMDWEYTTDRNISNTDNSEHQLQLLVEQQILLTQQQQEKSLNQQLQAQELYLKQYQKVPAPPIPPKIRLEDDRNIDVPPPLPPKIQHYLNEEKKEEIDDNDGLFFCGEKHGRLRTLNIPECLQDYFLDIARNNTNNNIETCGILGGKLEHDELFITSLLIPNQEGTSDTCITHDEQSIFEYQDKNELITLGWIHTHPSQSCFLSSVDLHTHCSYQIMLPEAVAVVCAPNYNPNFGIFRLTSPKGLKEITNCRVRENFHMHLEDQALYEDNLRHVKILYRGQLDVVDLRTK